MNFSRLAVLTMGILFAHLPSTAQPASTTMNLKEKLNDYTWQKRVLLVFSPSTDNPKYAQQTKRLQSAEADLHERDMVTINLIYPQLSPDDRKFAAQTFGVNARTFRVILLGKDGGEKLRFDEPAAPDAIFRTIDQMPMRQQEMRGRN